MSVIYSERLKLLALSYEQLLLLAQGRHILEQSLGLARSSFELSAGPEFLEEFTQVIPQHVVPAVQQHAADADWYTHWLVIDAAANLTIGGIGMNGLPDANGEVMIGYFIDRKAENRGYATEAVQALTGWIATHPQARAVIADTLVSGIASQQVLQKNGFVAAGETDEGLRWKRWL